jgi:hypothetical protein
LLKTVKLSFSISNAEHSAATSKLLNFQNYNHLLTIFIHPLFFNLAIYMFLSAHPATAAHNNNSKLDLLILQEAIKKS